METSVPLSATAVVVNSSQWDLPVAQVNASPNGTPTAGYPSVVKANISGSFDATSTKDPPLNVFVAFDAPNDQDFSVEAYVFRSKPNQALAVLIDGKPGAVSVGQITVSPGQDATANVTLSTCPPNTFCSQLQRLAGADGELGPAAHEEKVSTA